MEPSREKSRRVNRTESYKGCYRPDDLTGHGLPGLLPDCYIRPDYRVRLLRRTATPDPPPDPPPDMQTGEATGNLIHKLSISYTQDEDKPGDNYF